MKEQPKMDDRPFLVVLLRDVMSSEILMADVFRSERNDLFAFYVPLNNSIELLSGRSL